MAIGPALVKSFLPCSASCSLRRVVLRNVTVRSCKSIRMATFEEGDSYGDTGLHWTPDDHLYTHRHAVIFLHGLGDTAEGWLSFARLLRRRQGVFQRTKFILPTAPTRPITLNAGFPMPGWSDISGLKPSDPEDERGFEESRERISNMIKGELRRGIAAERIVLGGFSQGGATSYLTALSLPYGLGGIVGLSAWLPLSRQPPTRYASIPQVTLSTPVLHCHGTADPVVQLKWGKSSVEELKSMGMKVEMKVYEGMGHSGCEEELEEAMLFIESAFSRAKLEN